MKKYQKTDKPQRDLHQEVTDKLISIMEANPGSWSKPWTSTGGSDASLPFNVVTGRTYRGVNIPMLWAEQKVQGYSSAAWGSYAQWQAKGGQVRKGEKGTLIVFYKSLTVKDQGKPNDPDATKRIPLLRCWNVFNRDQVDGLPALAPAAPRPIMERDQDADAFIAATKAYIKHGGDVACYIPALDLIKLPQAEDFKATKTSTARENYYSTAFHELTHWSGAKDRCARDLTGRFGSDSYAMEELVAELGAAFLCAALGVSNEPRADHAQYLANWLRVLKADKKAIFTAASKASQSFDLLMGMNVPNDDEAEGEAAGEEQAGDLPAQVAA